MTPHYLHRFHKSTLVHFPPVACDRNACHAKLSACWQCTLIAVLNALAVAGCTCQLIALLPVSCAAAARHQAAARSITAEQLSGLLVQLAAAAVPFARPTGQCTWHSRHCSRSSSSSSSSSSQAYYHKLAIWAASL
jgi:hypothetical protein